MKLKIPPPTVAFISILIMWALSHYFPALAYERLVPTPILVVMFVLFGYPFISALKGFSRHNTTFNPHNPSQTRALVTTGVFAYSRNPMYTALLAEQVLVALWFANLSAILGLVFFVLYITHFQIKPEEQVLQQKFAERYEQYCQRVRRWV